MIPPCQIPQRPEGRAKLHYVLVLCRKSCTLVRITPPHTHSHLVAYMGLWIVDTVFFLLESLFKKMFSILIGIYTNLYGIYFFFFLIWEVTNIKIYWCAFFNSGTVDNYLYCSACT